ncbi:BnaC07g18290D [Brassica napus]|uniref:BnaC07g18290D protein n=1 Tax=Brassica napus TaxID=3708 RepID=A0A078IY56_BRANA|nr:BnaC07g18290D [Brassica napus]
MASSSTPMVNGHPQERPQVGSMRRNLESSPSSSM